MREAKLLPGEAIILTEENVALHSGAFPDPRDKSAWPPIAMVTPAYNAVHYIEQTIRSVLSQGYPNLEYFIVDGGSTDGTVDIIRSHEHEISGWISEPDRGIYDALNKGFALSTNRIMGWINANDALFPKALFVVGSVFQAFPEVEWITGIPAMLDELGMVVEVRPAFRWSRNRVLAGANRHIQQESTFWRRSLWEKAGGQLSDVPRVANDFELWLRFFQHARLYTVRAMIGAWRQHGDALSRADFCKYDRVMDEIIEEELAAGRGASWVRSFRHASTLAMSVPKVRDVWRGVVMKALYHFPGPDLAPYIEFQNGVGWTMKGRKG